MTLTVPPGACDCHVHVFGPVTRYPYDPARTYTPPDASLAELQALHGSIGVSRTVIVHPSPYGTDNRSLIDALHALGENGRGVAVVDEAVTDEELHQLHTAGVRGVRVNLETAGEHDPEIARGKLHRAAQRVAPLGWHVQTYTNLATFSALADSLADLPTMLVVDHFGRARASLGVEQPGLADLLNAVADGRVYVKLSAPYRISQEPDYLDAAPIARALIAANPERMLWGTDWPHPGSAAGVALSVDRPTPFRQEDDGRALLRCLEWAGSPEIARKILVDNPARLYGF
ncbi:amidohydrolase family protein [Bordetella sp. 15P40C-2]|uniref:amidohydrolase family protein n=1 Tax=Bordetella sp. 15P40C-2 TaxID=2572246 RepID=UPI00132AE4A8|nr:amidohydrolase family protein [Bordetella sp. 15P40C-2]MVW70035.1 amidohydrolase family protein [Bordetella sp. 15P40C-2]